MKTMKNITELLEAGRAADYRAVREELRETVSTLEAIYSETIELTPADTVARFKEAVGEELAQTAIATLVNKSAWDGRISQKSKTWAEGIAGAWDEEAAQRMGIYTNRIHMSHLDQIAREMTK